uniref:Stromal cellderived factor 2 putative n=1 Tax=Albugo laibachii Nc14 TaxID=890382 RepID=F0WJJ1_9STRA|nr:stromal cellderived factor 2 precursor putative [Albugo laibachii Nc14]|eukprot:CCA21440.1 stromal cellderived factor 2 precursor putative [Albugo laibachii Nc14]
MNQVCALFVLLFSWTLSSAARSKNEARCIGWRATSECSPHAKRKPKADRSCEKTISKKESGFCECEGRRRVRESTCDHHTFTCEKACQEEFSAELSYPEGFEFVTCGSSIKLVHEETRFRLHSHEISYGTGSKQQSVTAHSSRNDVNSYWIVKEANEEMPCTTGKKLQCGSKIRLEHASTRRNLHSHNVKAPLTKAHDEVSAFGVAGEGDTLDSWVLECVEDMQCTAEGQCEDGGHWKRGSLVRLRNAITGSYLLTSNQKLFDNSNCPQCPINGQQEVSATSKADEKTLWFAEEGIYVI